MGKEIIFYMNNARTLNYILAAVLLVLIARFSGVTASLESAIFSKNAEVKRNSTIETIHNRKSVRNFTDKQVSRADLVELVRAGMAAPSAANKQPWKFIIVEDRAKLDSMGDILPYGKMLKKAPSAIVVCGDMFNALVGVAEDYWVQDCSAATQNILLAAESMGLGAVWTATFPYAERMNPVKEILGLPDHIKPLNVIPIGYPNGVDKPKDKWDIEKVFVDSYSNSLKGYKKFNNPKEVANSTTHEAWVSLTVAEGKRLIAKGFWEYKPVKKALSKGKILITKGTTNTYIAEEFLNQKLLPGEYVLGHIVPKGKSKLDKSTTRPEIVIDRGNVLDIDYRDFLTTMSEADIVIKGASIINHNHGQAGLLVGHPTGGTLGNIYPAIKENNIRFIIPVGLEKESSQDINFIDEYTRIEHTKVGRNKPYVWSMEGELFTEIEALKQFANIDVYHMASGGIGGAEGAVSLCIRGSEIEVEKALQIIDEIQGEEEYIER